MAMSCNGHSRWCLFFCFSANGNSDELFDDGTRIGDLVSWEKMRETVDKSTPDP